MTWLVKATNFFSATLRRRGEDYFRAKAVTILDGDSSCIAARVKGTQVYDVYADIDEESHALICSCTCPYYGGGSLCKHIWATLTAAFMNNYLSGLAKIKFTVVSETDYEDDAVGFLDIDDEEPDAAPLQKPRTTPRSDTSRANLPDWRSLLAQTQGSVSEATTGGLKPWPAHREIIYFLNKPFDHTPQQRLVLEIACREPKQDGAWGEIKQSRIQTHHLTSLPDAEDRRILTMLHGARQNPYGNYYYPGSSEVLANRYELPGHMLQLVLPAIAQTGRLRLGMSAAAQSATPLVWDDGPAFDFHVRIDKADSGHYRLTGSLVRDGYSAPLAQMLPLSDSGFAVIGQRLCRFNEHGARAMLNILRKNENFVIPDSEKYAFLETLLASPALPPVHYPEDLQMETLRPEPRPRLMIRSRQSKAYGAKPLEGLLSFDYDGLVLAGEPFKKGVFNRDTRCYILRDADLEKSFRDELFEHGFRSSYDYYVRKHILGITEKKMPAAVRGLLEKGWQVEAEGKLYRRSGSFSLKVGSGIDWFEVRGKLEFEDGASADLPALLAAIRHKQTMVRLDDGSFGLLPEDWLKKYGMLAGLGVEQQDHVRFRTCQAALLDALLAAEPEASFDEGFALVRDELARFSGVQPAPAPEGFQGKLRKYQEEGLGWFHFLERFGFGGCLADDMGLGKTVQVLALLLQRRDPDRPSLIVVPKSLVFNWKQEAQRFAPGLRIIDHTGADRDKTAAVFPDDAIVITSYGIMRQDIMLLKDREFAYVVLDEAQSIKNAATGIAKASRLLKARHRLALSGTPIENHLGELWSLLEFLNPGLLGSAAVFQKTGAKAAAVDVSTRDLLARALRPFILRRTKEQVARELPPRIEQTLYCELEPAQRKHYDELRRHYRSALMKKVEKDGIGKSAIMILEALLRLRQAACHPGLIDKAKADQGSAKLDVLMEQLEDVREEGHKALVFSQFTSFLAIVRRQLDEKQVPYAYLDGKTRNRQAAVDQFQTDPGCPLFLISLKAGGLGLNLTAADYVFLLDPWWNPAVEAQAIDRTHRIGQTRQVFAYRIIARDTVEEKVLALQQTKRDLADSIIKADNSLIRSLQREDLELLLS